MTGGARGSSSNCSELFKIVYKTGLYRGLLLLFIYAFGLATLIPLLPTLITNYFASRYEGRPIDCQQFTPEDAPPSCQNAHSDAVQWSSWTSLVSNSFLSFLCAPLVGDLSDRVGRKPFVVVAFGLSLLPVLVVQAHLTAGLPLLWYYPANAVSGIVQSVVVFLSHAADVLDARHRTAGFGLIIAAFSLGFMIGPALGASLAPKQAVAVTLACCVTSLIGSVLFMNESLPAATSPRAGSAAPHRRPRPLYACLSLHKSFALVRRSSLFMRLALCMAIVGVVSEGIQDMLLQYLQLTTGFTTRDQGLLFTLWGACNMVVQGVVLSWLAPLLGEQRLLLGGLLLSAAEQLLLASVHTKGAAFSAVVMGSFAGVSWPAISAIKANNSAADEQGLVQGALAGIRALAQGLGPLAFAQVFSAVSRTDAPLGYRPGLVFCLSAALTALAACVAATIDPRAGRPAGGVRGGLPVATTAAALGEEGVGVGGAGDVAKLEEAEAAAAAAAAAAVTAPRASEERQPLLSRPGTPAAASASR